MAAIDEGLSEAMARAAKDLGRVMLYVLSRSKNYEKAKLAGIPVASELVDFLGAVLIVEVLA